MVRSVDLTTLVEEMVGAQPIGPDRLAAHGGEFEASRLAEFVASWSFPRARMPWALWHWTDDIRIEHGAAPPGDLDYLERGRLFGDEADLELRRDDDRVLWRLVGEPALQVPAAFASLDYWNGREQQQFRLRERTMLLWGAERRDRGGNPTGLWQEDRVGWARLAYPPLLTGHRRLRVRYREYLLGDNVELVWLLRLEPYAEGEEHA
jgi:hypothetical protein